MISNGSFFLCLTGAKVKWGERENPRKFWEKFLGFCGKVHFFEKKGGEG
jgi:hypothetical protein